MSIFLLFVVSKKYQNFINIDPVINLKLTFNPISVGGGVKLPPLGENCAKNQQNVQKVETNDWFITQI